jgi:hypothetical protein
MRTTTIALGEAFGLSSNEARPILSQTLDKVLA